MDYLDSVNDEDIAQYKDIDTLMEEAYNDDENLVPSEMVQGYYDDDDEYYEAPVEGGQVGAAPVEVSELINLLKEKQLAQ